MRRARRRQPLSQTSQSLPRHRRSHPRFPAAAGALGGAEGEDEPVPQSVPFIVIVAVAATIACHYKVDASAAMVKNLGRGYAC